MSTGLSAEALEAAARAAFVPHCHWPACVEQQMDQARVRVQAILATVAPLLIAEGRRQAAADIQAAEVLRISAERGTWATPEEIAEWAARIAEGGTQTAVKVWRPGSPCASCGSTDTYLDEDGIAACNGCYASDGDEA